MSATPRSAPPTAGAKLWLALARSHDALASYIEQCIATEGLCLSDFMVLEVLLHKGPKTISEIGARVVLANASMTAAVDRLERKSFVVRRNSETDRRARIVDLTEKGRAFISRSYARHSKEIEAVTSVLSQREKNQLRGMLKKLGVAAADAAKRRTEQASLATPAALSGVTHRKPSRR